LINPTSSKEGSMTENTLNSTNFNKRWFWLSIMYLLAGSIAVIVSVLIDKIAYTSPEALTLCFVIALFLTIVIYLSILKMRKGWELTDARFIFAVFFLLYGIFPPLLGRQKWDTYPEQINIQAALCFWLGSLGLLSSLLFVKRSNVERQSSVISPKILRGVRSAALIGFILGIVMLLLDYARLGGIFKTLAMERGDRMALMSAKRGNLPFLYFLFTSSAMYFYYLIYRTNWKTLKGYAFFGLVNLAIIGLWILEGERSNIIMLTLILLAIWSSKYPVRISVKWFIIFSILWFLFSSIAYVRDAITNSIRARDPTIMISHVKERFTWEWLNPGEFKGPYLTLTASIDRGEELKYGQTYLQAIPYLLPRSLYPGEKPLTVGHQFGKYMQSLLGRKRRIGVGFSPIAEAYINFGFIGPFIVMFLFGIGLGHLSSLRRKKSFFWVILYAGLLPVAWKFNRSGFANGFSYMVYSLGAIIFLYILILFIAETFSPMKKRHTEVTHKL